MRSNMGGALPMNQRVARYLIGVSFGLSGALAQVEPLSIKVSTRLIQVGVVAHDREGNPVGDLQKSDFEIFDDGKRRDAAFFSSEFRAQRVEPLSLPLNTFSNRLGTQASTNATVILLDGLNTHIRDQVFAKPQLVSFLEQIEPSDRVGIFALGQQLRVLHDLSTDASSLIAALNRYKGRAGSELLASELPTEALKRGDLATGVMPTQPMDPRISAGGGADDDSFDLAEKFFQEFVEESSRRPADFYLEQRVRWTARGLQSIGRYLAGIPGRKSLIWVSASFPLTVGFEDALDTGSPSREWRTFRGEIEKATRSLNEANVAVYPVDARGLAPPGGLDVEGRLFPSQPGRLARGVPIYTPTPRNLDVIHLLAERTGGKAFYNTNDIGSAVRAALKDSEVTYTLGFYANSEKPDGKFHDIKVRVKRKGVRVRHRKGYVARSEAVFDTEQRSDEIRQLLHAPIDATMVGIYVRHEPDAEEAGSVKLTIRVESSDITLQPNGERRQGKLEIVVAQKDLEGEILATESQTLDLNLTRRNYESITRDGAMLLWKTVEPIPEVAEFRVVIVDHPSGTMGSLRVPYAVN